MLLKNRRRPTVVEPELDRRGLYRSPVTLSSYRKGKPSHNRGRKFPADPPTPEEVYAMLAACGRGAAGRRDRAMIVMMWRAGLRCAELLALYPKDVDLVGGRVTVLRGKGGKRRVVALDPMACAEVDRWLRFRREKLGLAGRHPLFCVISRPTVGEPLHGSAVRSMVKRIAAKAGVDRNVRPHQFRHAYASYLGERVPLQDLQAALGHTSLAVTEKYLHTLNPQAVLDRMRMVPWPDSGNGARPGAGGAGPSPTP